MWRMICLTAALVVGASSACAEQWWYAYEADPDEGFPEECGWSRIVQGGGADRYFEDGALVIDGSANSNICDSYYQFMPSLPDLDHPFRMEWRLLVSEVIGLRDPGVAVSFAPFGYVILGYGADSIYSTLEGQYVGGFAPGVFHEYTLTSTDMLTYCLYVDGVLVHVGAVVGPSTSSWGQWGDLATGDASLSLWDYARFGVVPEPPAGLGLALAGLLVRRARGVRNRLDGSRRKE